MSPDAAANPGTAAGRAVTVRVPATSANLGPGFDTLGLAVSLYDTLTVRIADGPDADAGAGAGDDDGAPTGAQAAPLSIEIAGEGALELPRDESHLVVRAIHRTWQLAGFHAPGLRISAQNVIPHGRGLGSSASAIVSGVLAANALLPARSRLGGDALLQLCSELEGHPDNVAPALGGSLAVSWQDGHAFHSTRIRVAETVIPVVAVPAAALSTKTARGLLPAMVPHACAAANAGRAALLVHALSTDPSLLLAATEDRLHQQYRAAAMPASAELVRLLRADGHAAVISGAGPTVMVLAAGAADADAAESLVQARLRAEPKMTGWRVIRLAVDTEGAKVEEHHR